MKTQRSWVLGLVWLAAVSSCAVAQDLSAEPIAVGESLRVSSVVLNQTRQLQVYLPASYTKTSRRYPAIYALDGEGTAPVAASAVRFMTGYSAIPMMPEAIVVGIVNADRNRDMPIPGAYGNGSEKRFLQFLADEVVPLIEQRYRTQPLRILLGHSQGGLFAVYALAEKPALFQWQLSIDAPIAGFPEIKSMLEKARRMIVETHDYRGRLVSIENLYGWRKEWTAFIDGAQPGFYGERLEIKDETHETMAYKAVYEGLKRLFHDYAPNVIRNSSTIYALPALDSMYKPLTESYGYKVEIPEALLLVSASQNIAIRHGSEALDLIKRAEAVYGESSAAKKLKSEGEEAAKEGRDPRFEEWTRLKPPTVEQMKPFLGSWTEKRGGFYGVMAFEVVDGQVRAQYTGHPPSGDQFQLIVHFVRVLDARRIEFGLRNGRGPGITVHHAELVDANILEGVTEDVGFIQNKSPVAFTFNRGTSPAGSAPGRSAQRPGPQAMRSDLAIGTRAPDWKLKTVDGKSVRLSDLRGKVVVLDFWANWCGPCIKLMPLFDELESQYRESKVEFITLSIWPEEFDAAAFLRDHKMSSTFLIGDNEVAREYRIWGLPTYFVIDRTGNISYVHVLLSTEPEPLRKRLREAIEKSLS